jgi:two-component system, cell cycle response regulator DivK
MTRVAIVEDNADNRLLLQAILDGSYELVEYANGVDALAGFSALRPDLVLLDISLPGMDGNEILARIRADHALRTLPVIALTAHAMTGDREKYLAAGFNDYVTKPIVDEMILIGAIERWVGKSGIREVWRSGGRETEI